MTTSDSSDQFLAIVVLERGIFLHPESIVESIKRKAVNVACTVEIIGEHKRGDPLMLMINGVLLSVSLMEFPLPPDAYETAVRGNLNWPEARDVIARCRAHLLVAPLRPSRGSHALALQNAADLTRLCAALAEVDGARAVLWTNGDVVMTPSRIAWAANELAQKRIPLMSWMSVVPVLGPKTDRGEQTFALLTTGLQPFVGREIEFPPSVMKPEEISKRVLPFAYMLMMRGTYVKDGETIGISADDFILVKERPQGQRRGIPVFSLSPKQTVP